VSSHPSVAVSRCTVSAATAQPRRNNSCLTKEVRIWRCLSLTQLHQRTTTSPAKLTGTLKKRPFTHAAVLGLAMLAAVPEQAQTFHALHKDTDGCTSRPTLLCGALAIVRVNDLSIEHARRLSQCQVIGHWVEVAVVFGFVHADCLEEESFPFHVHTQDSHFPVAR
jgi:hypothetical protein